MSPDPLITLTTDFGHEGPFAGVMKGVILSINREARIVDLTHGVKPHDIREAAFVIGANYSYFPEGTIHVVVVDPGVGSERRPVAASVNGHYFVGPDNGVFSSVYRSGVPTVVEITSERYVLSFKSPTFQGRDVFAPAAAWLSKGIGIMDLGNRIDDYKSLELSLPVTTEGGLGGEVIYIDRFGNAITNITEAEMQSLRANVPAERLRVRFAGMDAELVSSYAGASGQTLCALINSSGYLELFIDRGNASRQYSISVGDPVELFRT